MKMFDKAEESIEWFFENYVNIVFCIIIGSFLVAMCKGLYLEIVTEPISSATAKQPK